MNEQEKSLMTMDRAKREHWLLTSKAEVVAKHTSIMRSDSGNELLIKATDIIQY